MPSSSSVESSPSLPPPVTRYFDLLPPELVQPIVQFAIRSRERAPKAYRIRLATLRSLSLTSKRLHSFALPLLLKHVCVDFREDYKALELLHTQVGMKNLELLHKLNLDSLNFVSSSSLRSLEEILAAASSLQEAPLQFASRGFPLLLVQNITTLSLSYVSFSSLNRFYFPQVLYFAISWSDLEGVEQERIGWDLPSVKHFALRSNSSTLTGAEARLLLHIAPSLTSAHLSIPSESRSYPPEIISSPAISCIYTTTINQPPQDLIGKPSLTHLCLTVIDYSLDYVKELMTRWTEMIGQGQHQLQWLCFLCRPDSMELLNHLRKVDRSLLDACDRRGISVAWEETSMGSEFWDVVSPTFIRMAEERPVSE